MNTKNKPDIIYACPVCGHKSEMEAQETQFEHARKKGIKKGMWFYYVCRNCEVSFTTTQSDELSIKRWNENTN